MDSEDAISALSALAQPSRLSVFKLLVRAGPEGMAAGDIARAVGTPANTMSAHLSILENSGLIHARRAGRTIFYAIEQEHLRALFGYLVADCCAGKPELCAPLLEPAACCEPA
jgi:ArsR family transcriptional regulator, arsenate/arsenite/antimonite-responsive transcriptional repressor